MEKGICASINFAFSGCLYIWFCAAYSSVAISRKPCSGYKMKEMTGSGIFAANGENDESEPGSANPTPNNKTGIRMYQVCV